MISTSAIDGRLCLLRTVTALTALTLAALVYPGLVQQLHAAYPIQFWVVVPTIALLEAHALGLLVWLVFLPQRRASFSSRRVASEAFLLSIPVLAGVVCAGYWLGLFSRLMGQLAAPYLLAMAAEVVSLARQLRPSRRLATTASPLDRALPTLLRRVALSRLYDKEMQTWALCGPDMFPARYLVVVPGAQHRLQLECEVDVAPYHLYCGHREQLRGLSTRQILELADAWEVAILECDLGRGLFYPARKLNWITVDNTTRTTPWWLRRLKHRYDWQAGNLEFMTGQLHFIHDNSVRRGNYGQLTVRGVEGVIDRDLGFFAIDNGQGGWDWVTRDLNTFPERGELVHSLSPDFVAARGTPWDDPLAAEREHLDHLVLYAYHHPFRRMPV